MASIAALLIVWLPSSIKLPVALLLALGGVCYVWAHSCRPKAKAGNEGNEGTPQSLDDSSFQFDFSDNQSWWHGLSIQCERCPFATVLAPGSAGFMQNDVVCGLMSAFHVISKGESRPGWGQGVYVCPTPGCNTYIRFKRKLMPDGSIPAAPEDDVETVDASQHWFD